MTYEEWGKQMFHMSGLLKEMYDAWTGDREVLKRGWIEDEHRLAGFIGYQRRHRKWALDQIRVLQGRLAAKSLSQSALRAEKAQAEAERDKIQKEWDEWVEKNAEWIGERSVVYAQRDKLAERVRVLEEALRSIAANTCCTTCQEAALVARAALEEEKK